MGLEEEAEIGCSGKEPLSRRFEQRSDEGGIEDTWGKINLGGKEGQCQVTEVGLSWACSRKSKENPVAGADVTETSVRDEHRGNVILDVMAV